MGILCENILFVLDIMTVDFLLGVLVACMKFYPYTGDLADIFVRSCVYNISRGLGVEIFPAVYVDNASMC